MRMKVSNYISEMLVKAGIHQAFMVSQGLESDGMNEIRGVFRHDHMNVGVKLHQHTGQVCRLIGRDAAADAKQYGFSFEHGKTPRFQKYSQYSK